MKRKMKCHFLKSHLRYIGNAIFGLLIIITQVNAITISKTNVVKRNPVLRENVELLCVPHICYDNKRVNILENFDPLLFCKKNASLERVMEECLRGEHLVFEIVEKTVVIKKKAIIPSFNLRAVPNNVVLDKIAPDKIMVEGKVVNDNGEPLFGVSVVVKGSARGTTTDNNGSFSIHAEEGETLEFSAVGFTISTIKIANDKPITIILKSFVASLTDVVIVGYGAQRKSDLTGAVDRVSQKDIKDLPVTNFGQGLKGQAAGVQIFQNTGSPSSGLTIRIRGNTSITAGNNPLYVIDGYPLSGGSGTGVSYPGGADPLSNINPNDIESIDILKDASATAIYGSRGSNGVVIITTKSGKTGKTNIEVSISNALQHATKKLPVLGAADFAAFHIESRNNGWLQSGGNATTPNNMRGRFQVADIFFRPESWAHTDWQDMVLRTGRISNYNVSASGGTENVRYAISGGYFDNDGIVINSTLKRFSFRSNVDVKVNDKLSLGLRFSPSYSISNDLSTEGHFVGGLIGMALRQTPLIGPYNPDGTYTNPLAQRNNTTGVGTLGPVDNPIAVANEDKFNFNQARILGNTFVEYKILKGLTFKTSLGIDYVAARTHVFRSSLTGRPPTPPPATISGSASSTEKLNWLNENVLTWQKSFGEHTVTAIAGYSSQKDDNNSIAVSGSQYPSNNAPYVNAAGVIDGGRENKSQWSLISYFGRVNYGFEDRYLVTATLRRDGSSRFGADKKYGLFPSAAFAWKMSNEKFMQHIHAISDLKWRVSYGVAGNNQIGNYISIASVRSEAYVLGTGQQLGSAIMLSSFNNPGVSWETTQALNIGFNLGLFNNRITLVVDAYKSNTHGLLLAVNIPAVSGFTTTIENIGRVQNKGLEFTLNTVNIESALKWNSSFNVSINRNKVLALGGSAGDFILNGVAKTVVGKPLGQFYARVTDGIFNSIEEINAAPKQDNAPQPGDRKFKDVNGDGKVDAVDLDFIGDPNPQFTFGLTNSFSYKGFDMNVVLNGSQGNDVYYEYATGANLNGNLNQDANIANSRWRSPKEPGKGNIPRPIFGYATLQDVSSDFFVFDGSYLRLTNITIGYTLSSSILQRLKLKNARVYLSGQNVWTFAKYPGYDPEIAGSGGDPTLFGIETGTYPMARAIALGINLTF